MSALRKIKKKSGSSFHVTSIQLHQRFPNKGSRHCVGSPDIKMGLQENFQNHCDVFKLKNLNDNYSNLKDTIQPERALRSWEKAAFTVALQSFPR